MSKLREPDDAGSVVQSETTPTAIMNKHLHTTSSINRPITAGEKRRAMRSVFDDRQLKGNPAVSGSIHLLLIDSQRVDWVHERCLLAASTSELPGETHSAVTQSSD
jgi:hypothetical protein